MAITWSELDLSYGQQYAGRKRRKETKNKKQKTKNKNHKSRRKPEFVSVVKVVPPQVYVHEPSGFVTYALDAIFSSQPQPTSHPAVLAVDKKIPVFLDGGVRRGTDVLKALALGATGIFIGRRVVWGLALAGEAGVSKVLSMLKEELELGMALLGCTKVSDIKRSLGKERRIVSSSVAHPSFEPEPEFKKL